MAKEYKRQTDIASQTTSVIGKWHLHLKAYRLVAVGVTGGMKSKDKTVFAKVKVASAMEECLGRCDIILQVNMEIWVNLNGRERRALLDHEMCHVREIADKDGGKRLTVVHHDIGEFAAIINRHGLWDSDLKRFFKAIGQYDLFTGEKHDEPEPATGATSVTFTTEDVDGLRQGAAVLREAGDDAPGRIHVVP